MPRTDRTPRRRLDPQKRRELILDAATAAFCSQPYGRVSISMIASQADASEALLYRYYPSKADLYAVIVTNAVDELIDRMRTAADEGSRQTQRDRVRATVEAYLDYLNSPAGRLLLADNDPMERWEVREELRTHILDSLAEIARFDSRDRIALIGYLGFIETLGRYWAREDYSLEKRPYIVEASLGALFGSIVDLAKVAPVRLNKFGRPL